MIKLHLGLPSESWLQKRMIKEAKIGSGPESEGAGCVAWVPSGTSTFPFQHFLVLVLPKHSCVPCEGQKHCLAVDPNDNSELDVFLAPDRCSIIVLMIVSKQLDLPWGLLISLMTRATPAQFIKSGKITVWTGNAEGCCTNHTRSVSDITMRNLSEPRASGDFKNIHFKGYATTLWTSQPRYLTKQEKTHSV